MSSNKIETADFEFEVSDEIYDAIQNILKPYAVAQSKTYIPGKVREYVEKRTKEYFGEGPTSPTVEKPIKVLPLSEFVPIDKKHGTLHVPTIVVISMMKKINEIIDVINK